MKTVYSSLLLTTTLLSIASCTQKEEVTLPTSNQIAFTTTVTRGTPIEGSDTLRELSVFAFYTGDGEENKWSKVGSQSTANWMDNIPLVETDGVWQSDPAIKWPEAEEANVTFLAYSPTASTENGIEVVSGVGAPTFRYTMPEVCKVQPDLLVSPLITDRNCTTPCVGVALNHALAAIGFAAKGDRCNIEYISLDGVYTAGDLILSEAGMQWGNLSQEGVNNLRAGLKTITLNESMQQVNSTDGYLMVIPQTLPAEAKIVIKREGREEEEVSIAHGVWSAGDKLLYQLEIESDTAQLMLIDFMSDAYIAKIAGKDHWNIMDAGSPITREYSGLRSVLRKIRLATPSRGITVTMPNLIELETRALTTSLDSRMRNNALVALRLPIAQSIGYESCFSLPNLSSIYAPHATQVENHAFNDCTGLTSLYLPKVERVGAYAFKECDCLTTVDLPSATQLDRSSFVSCDRLSNVSMPQVNYIPLHCFEDCVKLESFTSQRIDSVGYQGFYKCNALHTIDLSQCRYIDGAAFSYCKALTKLDLQESDSIEAYAFDLCTELTQVDLSQVKSIGKGAFKKCAKLERVEAPLATHISESSFYYCSALSEAILPLAGCIPADAFGGCIKLERVTANAVTQVDERGFRDCSSLPSIELPLLVAVGQEAFAECEKLESIVAPQMVTLGIRAFYYAGLKSVEMDRVTTLYNHAFSNCSQLERVSLPSATTLEQSAFEKCSQLKYIKIGTTAPFAYVGDQLFYGVDTSQTELVTGTGNGSWVYGNNFQGSSQPSQTGFCYPFKNIDIE